MGGVWWYRWGGIPALRRGRPQSGTTGSYSAMGMRSSGRSSTSILGWKVYSRVDAAGRVHSHLHAGWPRAVPLLNKNVQSTSHPIGVAWAYPGNGVTHPLEVSCQEAKHLLFLLFA